MAGGKKSRIIPARPAKVDVRANKHRFSSFQERIATLQINPIQKARLQDERAKSSYFASRLTHWKDLNLSESFVKFVKDVSPYSHSLVQILHHEQAVIDLLVANLKRRDSLDLEALLDLTAQLAHDLGHRFEKHYAVTIATVADIVGCHQSVEVLEWSFNTLAWMFHYLSRLLVPDLRATFDIICPLLGKVVRKSHIARFAAEALSFLLRKAALRAERDEKPLHIIMNHIFVDWAKYQKDNVDTEIYAYGLMNLFVECINDIKTSRSIRPYGLTVFKSLLSESASVKSFTIAKGVLTNMIHHTNKETFRDAEAVLTAAIQSCGLDASNEAVAGFLSLLDVMIEVRKGDRVSDWPLLFEAFDHLESLLNGAGSLDLGTVSYVTRTAAAIVQISPFDSLFSRLDGLMKGLMSTSRPCDFPRFCIFAAAINRERFAQLLRPYFFRFLADVWDKSDVVVLFTAQQVWHLSLSVPDDNTSSPTFLRNWPQAILISMRRLSELDEPVERVDGLLSLASSLPSDVDAAHQLRHYLEQILEAFVRQPDMLDREKGALLFGRGLAWCLKQAQKTDQRFALTWDQLLSLKHKFGRMPSYVENLQLFCTLETDKLPDLEDLQQSLIANLSSDSKRLRLATLRLFDAMRGDVDQSISRVFEIALKIEQTSLDFTSVRNLATSIQALSNLYSSVQVHTWVANAIIYYLFGILNFNLTPIWNDATSALKQIYQSETGTGAQLVDEIVFKWLEERSLPSHAAGVHPSAESVTTKQSYNEFQCPTHEKQSVQFSQITSDTADAWSKLRAEYLQQHDQSSEIPSKSSSQALRVLKSVPELAERRSRRLVPLFLAWVVFDEDREATLLGDVSSEGSSQSDRVGLSWQDRLAMLDVFAAIGNPKALYRSQDVYDGLLRVLSSGDVATQKVSLKAISKWKKQSFLLYNDQFNNLLDTARFREELVMFMPQKMEEKRLSTEQRKEMMQVLLPLLFGRVTARGKSSAGKMTQLARRRAVFESLGAFPSEELAAFLDIALGPLKLVEVHDNKLVIQDGVGCLDLRRQLGFVRLAKDMLEAVGDKVKIRRDCLLRAILYCISLNIHTTDGKSDSEEIEDQPNSHASIQKTIRQTGLQALCSIFRIFSSHSFQDLQVTIYSTIVAPKLGHKFSSENAQSVSGLLKLFSTWAVSEASFKHLTHDETILEHLTNSIAAEADSLAVKSHVKIFIINDILKPLMSRRCSAPAEISLSDKLLERVIAATASVLEHDTARELIEPAVSLILQMTPSLLQNHGSRLAEVFCVIMNLPNHQIKPQVKAQVLSILRECMPGIKSSDLLQRIWQTLSKQFTIMRSPWRSQLSDSFLSLGAAMGGSYVSVATICWEMNAMSKDQLEEPDLEKRSRAFEKALKPDFMVADELWAPIVHNCLFFIRDQNETFIRQNSSHLLRSFIAKNNEIVQNDGASFPNSKVLRGVLHPALRKGATERIELIRVEYVTIMEQLAIQCQQWPEVQDLTCLTTTGEDGESFFGGVTHIQQEWRKRSLLKLARVARHQRLGSDSISHFLLPLIEHFVFDRADETDTHTLAAQTITTIGALCNCLSWVQARKTLRRYTSMIKDRPELEKATIRLIGAVTESIYDVRKADNDETALGRSFPVLESLTDDITNTLLPPLLSFLHHKDENVVSLRVPIAVSATRLICLLQPDELESKLAPVLTDVCNILRSKAQESRDLSRKTLAEITSLIGPERFSFVLKELRIALGRGYQLHVKSYTLHSLLVAANFNPGDLDYCLVDIMAILLDDIFGVTGQEKDADGYTNKAKEVKGSKSMDSAERMASIATITHLKEFLNPVQTLLAEHLDLKSVTKIDELLRRIGSGLQQNTAIGSQDTLIFCYQILQQSKLVAQVDTSGHTDVVSQRKRQQEERFELKNIRGRKARNHSPVTLQHFKLARFAIDLLRVVLHRHESLRTPASLSGFLTPVGDILLEAQEEVQTAALRLLAGIMKVPMIQWKTNAPVYVDTAFKIVLIHEPSTHTELSQAAIKLVTSVLRDRPEVSLKASQITSLVKVIIPDLTQPARQGVTFNYLKAVVSRAIVSNEVYQAMDAIARLFVTYGDASARNQARSIWLQFVLEYEQSEARFKQILNFLVLNLTYDHAEGRQSIMEAIHFLIGKLDTVHLHQMCAVLFKPLLGRVVSDDTAACRDMAALLIKEVYCKANDDQFNEVRHHLRVMYEDGDSDKKATSLQGYGLLTDADPDRSAKDAILLRGWLSDVFSETRTESGEWKLVYAGLQLALKLAERYPDAVFSVQFTDFWRKAWQLSSFPHAWVKLASARLLASYISEAESQQNDKMLEVHGTKNRMGIHLEKTRLVELAYNYLRILRRDNPEWLIQQIATNLEIIERLAGDTVLAESDASGQSTDDSDHEEEPVTLRGLYIVKISQIIRQDKPLVTKQAALQLLFKMVEHASMSQIKPSLQHVLSALNHMTDFSISKTVMADSTLQGAQQGLVDLSHQALSILQKRLPDGEYVSAMHLVQQEAKRKRDERRRKRAIEAVATPEKRAREKIKKREQGRVRKREINSIHRSRRRGW